ncbi:hypothetical protein BpHYR1_004273 [Brachionus plicatilis]|uniref:Uncharacterized protein n=1 Tax=Brachionus plicatilis TaxID=10195 RepID=A0A3M7QPQ3_BRAPC|nr:hypothetical protein BpHYR1_004273 [Brachionus plicatilis]
MNLDPSNRRVKRPRLVDRLHIFQYFEIELNCTTILLCHLTGSLLVELDLCLKDLLSILNFLDKLESCDSINRIE